MEKHGCILETYMPGRNYCAWTSISKSDEELEKQSFVAIRVTGISSAGMAGRPVSCSFSPLKSAVLRKETICAL